ncbi:hypothetical protein RchiOBHm_Chr6g0263001 [Rosa chinensis]|uniref:Uncharacterized protein n=1 Tax=Rosa chinensis TaxID=74649 RepID=A0A2P6PNU9_ROSCH|nr:hypothetical protein RchiOBHm_Chr6g0263001 [Rosa chinensis]
MNPSYTSLREPQVKTNNQGRPRKEDTSTRCLPSAFEYMNAFSSHDIHLSDPTVGSRSQRNKLKKLPKNQ